MKPAIVLTQKIQLLVNSPDPEIKKQVIDKLYSWQNMCFRSANYVLTHQFIQDQIGELFYMSEAIKLKFASIHKDADGVLTTSRENTTYQVLANHFKGMLPSDIYTGINHMVVKKYNLEREEYWKGQKPLPNYKRDIPMPIKARSIKEIIPLPDNINFSFTLFQQPFRTCFKNKKNSDNKRTLFEEMMLGRMHCGDSLIQLVKGKIFLLLVTYSEKEKHTLSENIIAEASLSTDFPVTVSIGTYSYRIGNKEEFLYRRLAIQAAVQRAQVGSNYCHAANGKKRKCKAVTRYRGMEENYIDSRLHVYSRRLIDLCIKHGAAILVLVAQHEKEQLAKNDEFLLRNWSYAALKEKIMYKAQKAGITVIVD
jgi:cytochrome c553